jgi:transposase
MAQAYSNDLRCKILESYQRGEGSLRKLAERFAVSHGYAKKIHREQRRTGQMARKPQSRYGPVSLVTVEVEEQLRAEVKQQPDVTLRELQQRLQTSRQVQLSRSRWGVVLQRLGLRRKKNSARARTGP